MSTYSTDQLYAKLAKADAAGDTEAAKVIAAEIRKTQAPASNSDFGRMVSGGAEKPRGLLGELGHQVGLTARYVMSGPMQVAGIFTDPIAHVLGIGNASEGAQQLGDLLGLPNPEGAKERVVGDVSKALTGALATMGTGALAPATSGVNQFLTAQPVLQGLSAATGATAAGVTREGGGGPTAQTIAGLVGGFAPGTARAATTATANAFSKDRAAQKLLAQLYGSTDESLLSMENAPSNFPGEKVTAHQAIQTPDTAGAEQALRNTPEGNAVFARMADANNQGRIGVIERLSGGTTAQERDAAMAMAKGDRKNITDPFRENKIENVSPAVRYRNGSEAIDSAIGKRMSSDDASRLVRARTIMNQVSRGRMDEAKGMTELKKLMPTSATAQRAIERASAAVNNNMVSPARLVSELNKLSKSGNPQLRRAAEGHLSSIKANQDSRGMMPIQSMDEIRQTIGQALEDAVQVPGGGSVLGARYGPFKQQLTNTVERAAPGYRAHLRDYATMSEPINTMESAGRIMDKVYPRGQNASGNTPLLLSDVNQGLRQDARGRYGMSKQAMDDVTGVQKSLQRAASSNDYGVANSATVKNAQGLNALAGLAGGNTMMGRGLAMVAGGTGGGIIGGAPGVVAGSLLTGALKAQSESFNRQLIQRVSAGAMDAPQAAKMIRAYLSQNRTVAQQLLEANPGWQAILQQATFDSSHRREASQ